MLRCRPLGLPAPDYEPHGKDQLHERHWKEESKMCVWVEVWLQRIDHPAQSVDYEQNPDNLGDVARPVNQKAQQTKMNAENDQAHGPIVTIRIEQKHNLRMQWTGAKGCEVIRGMKKSINGR